MPLTKSKGQMYEWVSNTHTHIDGRCGHQCSYCYVQAMAKRFPEMKRKYSGKIRLSEKELEVNYGKGRTIFIEHMNDLFARDVPATIIHRILDHCAEYPGNTYVFQTKNPSRFQNFIKRIPPGSILGTTIESDRHFQAVMQNAPNPVQRYWAMMSLRLDHPSFRRFVTVEPILDFDPAVLVHWLKDIHPAFVNIGADSKGHGLPEPSKEKVLKLIELLKGTDIEIRQKTNLARILNS